MPENWGRIDKIIKNSILSKLKVLEKTENYLKIQIDQKYGDSILTAQKTKSDIILKIEKRFLSFLPDYAEN